MKPAPVSETRDLRDDVMSAKNDNDAAGRCGEDEIHSPGGSTTCVEIRKLLKQWLPVYSLPDAIEIVDNMPFTKHGKFLMLSSTVVVFYIK